MKDLREKLANTYSDEVRLEIAETHAKDEAIGFGVWLSVNCEQSNSKDAWWFYKSNWKTTDECYEIYQQQKQKL